MVRQVCIPTRERGNEKIQAMVEVMQPAVQERTNVAGGSTPGVTNSGYVVADPACGASGFLLTA